MCLEEMLGTDVPCGAIYYGQTRRRLAILFDGNLRKQTITAALRLHALVDGGVTPPADFQAKCEACSLNELCLPKAMSQRRNIKKYLKDATSPQETIP
jgi:CRISPR-associated exonuclease Cas4